MAEVFTYDNAADAEVLSSIATDEAESLAIGEQMQAEQSEMLAGKYRDASELEKAYLELEKKLGSNNEAEESVEEEVDSSEESDYGVEFLSAINEEFANNGELSEETLAAFDNLSSRELFEAYQRYQDAYGSDTAPQGREMSDQEVNQIHNSVGGAQAYNDMTTWAADNFSPEEVEAFDSLVDSGNTAAIKLALQALQYRYQDANGYEGEMLTGKPAQSSSGFRSQAELVQAMSDPRYDNDEAYRDDVIQRLSRSDISF